MPKSQPVAYFDMRTRGGLPFQRVYELLREVLRIMGHTDSGPIELTDPCECGRYLIAFHRSRAADLFERLCRRAGYTPARSSRMPEDMHAYEVEIHIAGILVSKRDFMRRMAAPLN